MRYTESAPRSAELLRLVLPSISKHGGTYVPTAYAVWYEHLAGTNLQLTGELSRRLQQTDSLDQSEIDDLYSEHILSRDVDNSRLLQKSLEALAERLAQAARDSSGGTEQFALALDSCQAELRTIAGDGRLQAILRRLADSTDNARESIAALRSELDSSQTELRTLRERLGSLQSEAVHDPLTGLLNRRGFDQAVEKLCAESADALYSSALLMVDIDHFKRVNDTYGHLFGDQVLRATAKVLNSVIKGRDIAARFGGEEFMILLPETPERGALALAEQFRQVFAQTKVRRAGTDRVIDKLSVSVGVAAIRPGEPIERALERADKALYRAKNNGRNCVRTAEAA